jgi:2Fe-2S ferredoxin
MTKLRVVNSKGEETVLEAQAGQSLMEVMRNNGVDDMQALCGGACSCATCHVWVDPACMGKLPEMSSQENDMLDCAEGRRETSRLSCQLKMTEGLDGIRVTVAPV